MKIDIQIDKIVLEGIDLSPRELEQLQASIEFGLTQRVMKSTTLATIQCGRQRTVKSEPVDLCHKIVGQNLGSQIANSVLGGIVE